MSERVSAEPELAPPMPFTGGLRASAAGLLNPLPRTPRNPHSDPRTDRNHIDSYVPQQDLVDSYLPSFQTCVEEGKVSGVMVRGERVRRALVRRTQPTPPFVS